MAQIQTQSKFSDIPIAKSGKFLDAMKQEPRFSWDWVVPSSGFWQNLTPKDAQAIQRVFSPEEVENMKIDTNLPREEKLEILLQQIKMRYEAKERDAAPQLFHEHDYKTWSTFAASLSSLLMVLKDFDEAEKYIIALIIIQDPNAAPAVTESRIGGLAFLRIAQGRYAEAEQLSRRTLKWIEDYPKCGPVSPMALGTRRMIIESVWKQGRKGDAKALHDETSQAIDRSEESQFSKYASEERDALLAQWEELQVWIAQ